MSFDLTALAKIAPSMKRALTITAVAAAAGGALLFMAVLPSRARLLSVRSELAGLNETIARMRADIIGTEQQRTKTAAAEAKLNTLTSAGVIDPLLGSFAMRGKALLTPLAQETGFVIDSVKELPPIPLQVPAPPPEQLYARQPVEFTGHGTYDQTAAFIARVEASLPLTTLSGLLILSLPQTPETHKALITFEWPTKGEKRLPPVKNGN